MVKRYQIIEKKTGYILFSIAFYDKRIEKDMVNKLKKNKLINVRELKS